MRRAGPWIAWRLGAATVVAGLGLLGAVPASHALGPRDPVAQVAAAEAPPDDDALRPPDPPWGPWADPQRMLESIFGPESDDDRRRLARITISPREEQELGKAAVGAMLDMLRRRNLAVTSRGKEVAYLRDLVDTIRPHTQLDRRYREIQIHYVDSDVCEARAFPGGTLFFFRGLLQTAPSEAALVGIVGHELSHLERGHLLTRLRRAKLVQQGLAGKPPGVDPQPFFAGGSQMLRLWTRPFQPEAESEADLDGARWAYRAGYDPRAMADLLQRAARQRPRFPLPEFLQSHPDADQRSRAILALYDELQRDDPTPNLYLGRENLRRRTALKRQRWDE